MRRDKARRGFALVLVLWTLLLLAVIGASLLADVRTERVAASDDERLFQAKLIADGAINLTILDLIDPANSNGIKLDGASRHVRLFGHDATVVVTSESGKVDLNETPAVTLAALFRSQGVPPSESDAVAQRIVGWRTRLTAGALDAETNLYREAGRSYTPRHGHFRSVGELRLVLGMTDALQTAVAPLVTVYSHESNVDRGVASDRVLDALSHNNDTLAFSQAAARAQGQAAGADRGPKGGEAVSIAASLMLGDVVEERTAVVQLGGDLRSPYAILAWQ